jgi:hypothetical protein
LPLTGPVLAPGGQLATLAPSAPKTDTASLVEQTFATGKPAPTTPGRADDFAWPRKELAAAPPPQPAPAPVEGPPAPPKVPAAAPVKNAPAKPAAAAGSVP